MGNLLRETPYSEISATLEVLDRLGVTRTDLGALRYNNGNNDTARCVATVLRDLSLKRRISEFQGAIDEYIRFNPKRRVSAECPRCRSKTEKHTYECMGRESLINTFDHKKCLGCAGGGKHVAGCLNDPYRGK